MLPLDAAKLDPSVPVSSSTYRMERLKRKFRRLAFRQSEESEESEEERLLRPEGENHQDPFEDDSTRNVVLGPD